MINLVEALGWRAPTVQAAVAETSTAEMAAAASNAGPWVGAPLACALPPAGLTEIPMAEVRSPRQA